MKSDTQRARTDVAVYVAAAAARKSGTHGFGDGDACCSNGCAPPGPDESQPAALALASTPSIPSSAKERDLKKRPERGKNTKGP